MMTIGDEHLKAVKEVCTAFEERWPAYAQEKYSLSEEQARKFSLSSIDEEGDATFTNSGYYREDDEIQYMPFSAIVGTTEEMIATLRAERAEAERKRREREEESRKRIAEARRREAEKTARLRAAERDRIFREEAALRGITIP